MTFSTPSADETQLPLEAEDVFFSITDSRGVITHANDVFVRLSGYSADDLVGSPHNIIRHPDMPGGAFALLWDALDAGLPASAYVSNRAQDGERYDVFATLVPVGDGFLSIRLRPELDDFHAIVQGAYDEAREAELKAREDGRNAREAARVGAKKLGDALASLGYNGLDDLARRVLPRELLAHRSRVTPLPRLTDGPAAVLSLIEMARSIEADLHRLAASLNSLDELAEQVAQRSDTLVPTIERLQGMSTEVRQIGVLLPDVELDEDDRTEGPTVPRAKKAAVRIGKLLDEAVDGLRGASGQLDEVRESIRDLAMRVSLLVLDAVMIGRFGTEIVQSPSDVDRSEEIVLLHQALAEGGAGLGTSVEAIRGLQARIPESLSASVNAVDRARRRLSNWVGDLGSIDEADGLGDSADRIRALVASVDGSGRAGGEVLDDLVNVAVQLGMLTVHYDHDTVEARIDQTGALAGVLS